MQRVTAAIKEVFLGGVISKLRSGRDLLLASPLLFLCPSPSSVGSCSQTTGSPGFCSKP